MICPTMKRDSCEAFYGRQVFGWRHPRMRFSIVAYFRAEATDQRWWAMVVASARDNLAFSPTALARCNNVSILLLYWFRSVEKNTCNGMCTRADLDGIFHSACALPLMASAKTMNSFVKSNSSSSSSSSAASAGGGPSNSWLRCAMGSGFTNQGIGLTFSCFYCRPP